MSHYKQYQTHTNIVEARKKAVKILTRATGVAYYVNDNKLPKCRVIAAVKAGYYDGYFYNVEYGTKIASLTSFNANNFMHKIGN